MSEQKDKRELKQCPFCDEEIRAADYPWCRACGVEIVYCQKCGGPVSVKVDACPHCGAEIRKKA